MTIKEVDECRICGNQNLLPIVCLENQYLSGVFPATRDHLESLTHGPLELVKCDGEGACGLLQLRQSYSPAEMYGGNYGYRSALNRMMVDHLDAKVRRIMGTVVLGDDDWVLDIGSNDSTLLQAYPPKGVNLIGFDSAGEKFKKYYPSHVRLIPDFFSAAAFRDEAGGRRAKVVTSIAMLYDLERPLEFVREVHSILADDGVWVTEQSYMPLMIETGSYDTICHEHLEYYALKQIKWMADRVGFRIIDVETNDINGGSLSATLAKAGARESPRVGAIIDRERWLSEGTEPYLAFAREIERSRRELRTFLDRAKNSDELVCGLGASTKGNVILQHCGVTEDDLPFIGDVNSDKVDCFTPGTRIPIIPESEVLGLRPDYLLVLPWHFRRHFESDPKYAGSRLVFPLPPPLTVVGGRSA